MFCYGYLAAKTGIHIIDVSQIDGNVSRVMGQCAASPASPCRRLFGRRFDHALHPVSFSGPAVYSFVTRGS
jgi:hypothetical protein